MDCVAPNDGIALRRLAHESEVSLANVILANATKVLVQLMLRDGARQTWQIAGKAGHLPLGTFDRNLGKIDGAQKL